MAASEVFANQAFTTVSSGGATAGTIGTVETWTVASSSEFPSASTGVSQFHVTDTAAAASSEIVLVTATNAITNQWTVTRGAEGTSPVAHQPGFTITQVLTAGWLSGVSSGTSAVNEGGTGLNSVTPYTLLAGGTLSTTPFQQVASVGGSGQVLTSQGAGTLPAWVTATGLSNPMSALGDMISGGASGVPARLTGGTVAAKRFLTQTGAGTASAAPVWGTIASADLGIVAVPNGGTGLASLSTFAIVAGGTSSTTAVQQIAAGTAGQVLTGNGTGTLPSFQANVGFNNPMAVHGDMIFENAALAPAALSGNTASTKNFLISTGSGGTANTPVWGTIASADVPTLNQNTTGTASNVTGTVATINGGTGAGSVTAYAVVTGGTASTTALQTVSGLGTAAQGLVSNGAGSLPSWQTTVNTVTAADTTIIIAGTGAAPTFTSPRVASQSAKYGGVSGQPPRESVPFWAASGNNSVTAGVMYLMAIPVVPGDVISNIGFVTGSTGAFMGTSPNWWTALYTASGTSATFVAQSGTQGSTALTSAHAYLLALGSPAPYTVPSNTTFVYGAVMINTGAGGTQPTMRGPSMNAAQVDSTTSLFPTAVCYSATNGTGLGGTAPTGTITLAVNANLLYLGAD